MAFTANISGETLKRLNGNAWMSPVPNFKQIVRETREVRTEIQMCHFL
jgi:hypothetical protein